MMWKADDPRWDDLTLHTDWDNFVIGAAAHYKGKPLVYEIENEPEFDGWVNGKEDIYAKFTVRTARQIKTVDPKARIMVNNVYAIPSGLNNVLLKSGGARWIDILSWHDYHDGWLADALALRRMRNALDERGAKHIQIWFNEGWAFTNTIQDEPALALTHLTAAQSTNAMVDSVAELTVSGQEKTILFHTGYADRDAAVNPSLRLPFGDIVAEDAMGNRISLPNGVLTLSKTGRPVYIYSKSNATGAAFAANLPRHRGEEPECRAKERFSCYNGRVIFTALLPASFPSFVTTYTLNQTDAPATARPYVVK